MKLRLPRWRPDVDVRDVHVYGGLLCAGWGGWQLSPPLTLVALGVVLTALGVFARRRSGKEA